MSSTFSDSPTNNKNNNDNNDEVPVVRLFGTLQARTAVVGVMDNKLRETLHKYNAKLQWRVTAHTDHSCSGNTAVPLQLPHNNNSSGNILMMDDDNNTNASISVSLSSTTNLEASAVGTLSSAWVDPEGTEDPAAWVRGEEPQSDTHKPLDAPESTPLVFVSSPPSVRIEAYRKQQDKISRLAGENNNLTSEAAEEEGKEEKYEENKGEKGQEVNEKDNKEQHKPMNTTTEPPLRCPLLLNTTLTLKLSVAGAPRPFTGVLAQTKTYISDVAALPVKPLKVRLCITRGDITGMIAAVQRTHTQKQQREEDEYEKARQMYNPYAAGYNNNRDADDDNDNNDNNKEKEDTLISGLVDQQQRTGDDEVCGLLQLDLSFIDLSMAVLPVVNVHPDVTTQTSATALSTKTTNVTPLPVAFIPVPQPLSAQPPQRRHWQRTALPTPCIPYGCLPLPELYLQFVAFYQLLYMCHPSFIDSAAYAAGMDSPKKGLVRPSRQLLEQLRRHAPSMTRDLLTGCYRWESMLSLSFLRYILGDYNILPVLSLLYCCRGLEVIDIEQNALSTISMRRLFEVLKKHPNIRRLSVKGNTFFESAGEEVLRLLKVNRRIVQCLAGGNHFSAKLAQRIEKQAALNAEEYISDPYNFLSTQYGYLTTASDIPQEAWSAVHHVWTMLIAAPLTGCDKENDNTDKSSKSKNEGNNAGDDESEKNKKKLEEEAARTREALTTGGTSREIPLAVTSPLFAEAMRSVSIDVSEIEGVAQDRIIAGVFSDFSTQGDRLQEQHQGILCVARLQFIQKDSPLLGASYSRSYSKMLLVPLRVALHNSTGAVVDPDNRVLYWSDAVRTLQGLGEIHYNMGLRPRHYAAANKALVDWMCRILGPTVMDALTVASWQQVLALISRAVVSGSPQAEGSRG